MRCRSTFTVHVMHVGHMKHAYAFETVKSSAVPSKQQQQQQHASSTWNSACACPGLRLPSSITAMQCRQQPKTVTIIQVQSESAATWLRKGLMSGLSRVPEGFAACLVPSCLAAATARAGMKTALTPCSHTLPVCLYLASYSFFSAASAPRLTDPKGPWPTTTCTP